MIEAIRQLYRSKNINKIVYVLLDKGANFNQYHIAGEWLSAACKACGIAFEIFHVRDSYSLRQLLSESYDQSSLILLNVWLYDLRFNFFSDPTSGTIDIFGESRNILATIPDHPFATFMYSRVVAASKGVRYFMTDRSNLNCFSEIAQFNPVHQFIDAIPLPYVDITQLPQLRNRPIDVFVPSNAGHLIEEPNLMLPFDLSDCLKEAAGLDPYLSQENSVKMFRRALSERTSIEISVLRREHADLHHACFNALGIADQNWRHRFRIRELNQLAQSNPDLNFVVAGSPNENIQRENIKFVGFLPFDKTCNFIANSKAILHLHPTYFDGLHDRPLLAPAFGTPVLTRKMRWTKLLNVTNLIGEYSDTTEFRQVYEDLLDSIEFKGRETSVVENFIHHGPIKFLSSLVSS